MEIGTARRWLLVLVVAGAACRERQVVQSFPEQFAGIGLELRIDGDTPIAVRALPGGSAAEAGILPEDRLVAIDGHTTRGLTLGDVVMKIRGMPGSQITLELLRAEQRIVVVLQRRALERKDGAYQRANTP